MKEKSVEKTENRPQIQENWLNFALFTWLYPLQKKGRMGLLTENDFFALNDRDTSAAVLPLFDSYLEKVAAYKLNPEINKKASLMLHLAWIFKGYLASYTISYSLYVVGKLIRPILVQQMILFVLEREQFKLHDGYLLAVALLSIEIFNGIGEATTEASQYKINQRMTCLLASAVHQKRGKLTNKAKLVNY